ncbi:serpin family protein [Streptomyces piniterrae]|uniref:Serpin family protein n=2 Tax=Streptomyces piniterrae TaxID=2571125 RepID=A0A4U0NSC3_9ACTN|nr:serpin family protein [Streptomyces piniterrae]TJZ57496.1 serpin family protein [Streptomyces piniterrae]
MVAETTVRSVNDMTARWARDAVGERGTVLTAAGVWPLLALLAGPATGPARKELADALGTDAEHAVCEGCDLLAALGAADGVDAALGLWTQRTLALRPEWLSGLPLDLHGELTGDASADQEALNAWARRHTDGLIERMPVRVTPDMLLVLASALLVRTTWKRPFRESPLQVAEGPWAGRDLTGLNCYRLPAEQLRVHRTPAGPLTAFDVLGENGLDVQLLLGPEDMTGGEVLHHGLTVLGGGYPTVPGAELTEGAGPGLTVTTMPSWDGSSRADLSTVRFTVDAEHDLLKRPELFGLETATDNSRGHFPGISETPLAVSSARQAATATFGPLGFRAAAVTPVAMNVAGAPQIPPNEARLVSARFDRPFGFLAVHRASGLVLVAGWVTDPDGWDHSRPFGPGMW